MPRTLKAQSWWLLPSAAFLVVSAYLVLIPFKVVPYLGGDLVLNDVTLYSQWATGLRQGHYPVNDEMWQYPPLAGPVFALGSLLPPDPVKGIIALTFAADLVIFIALLLAGRDRRDPSGAWAWVLGGLVVGPVLLTRFDVFPALCAVLALLAMRRPLRAGAAIAVGTLLKVWPALLLLAAPRAAFKKVLLSCVVTGAAVLGGLLLWAQGSGSFLSGQRSRGLQVESVPALPFLVGHHLGHDRQFVYQYGAMEVVSDGISTAALIATALTLVGLGWIAWLRWRGRLEAFSPADVALVVVLLAMVTSRVLSPQYLIWVAAIAAVCLLDPDTVMRPAITMLVPVAALGQMIYPSWYRYLLSDEWPVLILQIIRVALLLAATGYGLWRLSTRRPASEHQVRVPPGEQVGEPA